MISFAIHHSLSQSGPIRHANLGTNWSQTQNSKDFGIGNFRGRGQYLSGTGFRTFGVGPQRQGTMAIIG
jgi:hypothetical protein